MSMVVSFTGEYAFLSNFYPSPFSLYGTVWPTAEHFFQACKTASLEQGEWIATAETPKEAKARGRQVNLRHDWSARRKGCMLNALLTKFGSDSELGERLLATQSATLVEGNTWGDDFWGAVPYSNHYPNPSPNPVWKDDEGKFWCGRNWLGRLLMTVRDVIDTGS